MKKNCDRCKALQYDGHGGYHCELGYQISYGKATRIAGAVIAEPLPAEACPKPLTYLQVIDNKQK